MRYKYKIFLSGGITGLNLSEQNDWRDTFITFLDEIGVGYKIKAFNPVAHIEELAPDRMNDRQGMDYNLWNLRNSDLVVMNFNNPFSIGTACEMGIAYENRIPILGLNLNKLDLHTWQKTMCSKIFTEWEWFIDYFVKHYVNEWL